jgi:Ankyrin repeats (3 copies)
MKRISVLMFATATAIVLWPADGWAQSEGQATFTSMVLQKLDARSEPAKVAREEESALMSKGYVEIGTISAFQPGKKSNAELAHLLESAILKKTAEVGGDVVRLSTEGELRTIAVPDGNIEMRYCVHTHQTQTVEVAPACTYCVPAVNRQNVCDKWGKRTETKYKPVKGVISEATVWRYDPKLFAEINGRMSLHEAAEQGKKAVVEWLLAHGAEVNAKDKNGDTPLHFAAFFGHRDVAELLLDNQAEVNAKDSNGVTPLHFAVDKRHEDVAELLRQHGGHE